MYIKKRRSKHKIIITFIVVMIAVIVGAGIFAWYQFLAISQENKVGQLVIKESGADESAGILDLCGPEDDDKATSGTFCSKEIGIKTTVPAIFAGTMTKAENYPVFQGSLNPNTKSNAGSALNVYRSSVVNSAGTFTFTIAQEPLRTGYVDMYHAMQNLYFDATTKELYQVNSPVAQSNTQTGGVTTSGAYTKGVPIPAFTAMGKRFFQGSNSEPGKTDNTYLTVIDDKILKISLKYVGQSGAANSSSKALVNKVYKELETSLRTIKTS